MPATPAWPPFSLPRLYIPQALGADLMLPLEGAQANYLGAVLRLREGDQVKLFDDSSGEWLAEVTEPGKRKLTLRILNHLRDRETVPDLWLLFAPIKRGRIDWMVEKATELGVARLVPVATRRSVVDRLNLDRLKAHAIEAAEQCERTALPEIAALERLESVLDAWPTERALLFADEGGGDPLSETCAPAPAAILIGPEGGFTDEERATISSHPQARPVSLGPRILRADTAAIAAVSVWMSSAGDWSHGRNR
jgi:16S rRNA (uracil1498-N3)-methyltransferase